MSRELGILAHVSSFGGFTPELLRFLDFLQEAGVRVWQTLPLGPIGPGGCPYHSTSAWAGEGSFAKDAHVSDAEIDACLEREFTWLADFALFTALREDLEKPWWEWPEDVVRRESSALGYHAARLQPRMREIYKEQYRFYQAWERVRAYARERGISIMGDLPFYVAPDSVDIWCNQELFDLGRVAGCPPDAFCAEGQFWGNPVYNFDAHRASGYSWWVARIRHSLRLYDRLRIDHFRAMEAFWSIPKGATSASAGEWVIGPGDELFHALGDAPLVAEDLGFLTPEVYALRDRVGLPGMSVLQFAFTPNCDSLYLPHHHVKHSVVYTGTHDNNTLRGWVEENPVDAAFACEYLGCTDPVEGLTRAALASVSDLAVLQLQDVLGLGGEARMNVPGTVEGNWGWKCDVNMLTPELAQKLREKAALYGRI